MGYFTIKQQFLIPFFYTNLKEEQIFTKYYCFLENSGVSNVIKRYINNTSSLGGRPSVNYFNLFSAIIYAFSSGITSLRDLEDTLCHDVRYITMMELAAPDYSTIAKFINTVIVPNAQEIFKLLNLQIIKEMGLNIDDAFIDGTKFEANANKYKFVWKPITFHERLSNTFFNIIKQYNLPIDLKYEKLIKSTTIVMALNKLEQMDVGIDKTPVVKAFNEILVKVLEYEEKERICGPNRNSYYKTDHDATAMCLKSDYYSKLGTNMHAAYNTQILVTKGIVLSFYVSQSRSDIDDFIPLLDDFYVKYGFYPKNVCADAGYGSLKNYKYLDMHNIGNYVKYASWEGNVSGRYPDCYRLLDDNIIVCLNNRKGYPVVLANRHPKNSGNVFFKVDDCSNCGFKYYCMKNMKNIEENTFKIFEVNTEFVRYKQEAEKNLLSPKGIEIRVNRSVQVEGVFGNEKQNYDYSRTKRRGIERVSAEIMLVLLGQNIKKLLEYYKTNKLLKFWEAAHNLEPQQFKKPSSKRLSKKGQKINKNLYDKK